MPALNPATIFSFYPARANLHCAQEAFGGFGAYIAPRRATFCYPPVSVFRDFVDESELKELKNG